MQWSGVSFLLPGEALAATGRRAGNLELVPEQRGAACGRVGAHHLSNVPNTFSFVGWQDVDWEAKEPGLHTMVLTWGP